MNKQISESAISVLFSGTWVGNQYYLPAVTLDRKLYEEVNKVLVALGGKWVGKKVQAHVFEENIGDTLGAVLETGIMPDKNPLEFFETPVTLAFYVAHMAEVDKMSNNGILLEPSAGTGGLLDTYRKLGVKQIFAIEVDPKRVAKLTEKYPYVDIHCGDFMDWSPTSEQKIERVVMNPPFGAYIEHINRAFSFLSPGGILVAIAPSGITFRSENKIMALRNLIEECGLIVALPTNTFKSSGTAVNTVLIKMLK